MTSDNYYIWIDMRTCIHQHIWSKVLGLKVDYLLVEYNKYHLDLVYSSSCHIYMFIVLILNFISWHIQTIREHFSPSNWHLMCVQIYVMHVCVCGSLWMLLSNKNVWNKYLILINLVQRSHFLYLLVYFYFFLNCIPLSIQR